MKTLDIIQSARAAKQYLSEGDRMALKGETQYFMDSLSRLPFYEREKALKLWREEAGMEGEA